MTINIFDLASVKQFEASHNQPKILCLDFDGVLHDYAQGWQGAGNIPGQPVPGAMEFLVHAVQHFSVHIYSSRCNLPGGIEAMCNWLSYHIHQAYKSAMTEYDAAHIISQLWFDLIKPPAWLTIDDRAIQFKGIWPDLEVLANFQPWYLPQTYTDEQLSLIWNLVQTAQDAHTKTDAQIVELLQDIWAKYDITSKESWVLMESMVRLGGKNELE